MKKLKKEAFYLNQVDGKVQQGASWIIANNMTKHRKDDDRLKRKDLIEVRFNGDDWEATK